MKELITRIEELAVQLAGAQLQIDKSEAESRELGRELGKARQKMMELVNERDHALARVPTESWAEENKRLAAQSEDLLGVIERRELLIKSLNDEIAKRDHELRAHEKELAEQREEIRKLMDGHAEDMKAQAELLGKYESLLVKITDLGSYAMTLGRKEGEPLEMFMERQALRLAALESQAGKIGYAAKGEHEEAVTAARENGIHKGESLSGFIWRQCEGLRKSQAENAPLNKLFVVLCKQRGNLNEKIIYRAVDEASEAINQLTA